MDGQRMVTYGEHEEFRRSMETENKRLSDEDKRQNCRIDRLEENVLQIGALTVSVEKLAISMEGMVREQEQQREKLELLEGRDGEMWRKVTSYAVTAVIGIALGFIFTQIGM